MTSCWRRPGRPGHASREDETQVAVVYLAGQDADRQHPVILTGLFVLDLLTIHPFIDGNGETISVAGGRELTR